MPTIRIDDEVWAWLKSQAQPFEDTPNTVLRRVAGLGEPTRPSLDATASRPQRAVRREREQKTPQADFRVPIQRILHKRGGCADRAHVLRELESLLQHRLTAYDRQDIKSGTIRWQKSAEWAVSTMRRAGLLVAKIDSPRGVWCLSPAGESEAKRANASGNGRA